MHMQRRLFSSSWEQGQKPSICLLVDLIEYLRGRTVDEVYRMFVRVMGCDDTSYEETLFALYLRLP